MPPNPHVPSLEMTSPNLEAFLRRAIPWTLFAVIMIVLQYFWALIILSYILGSLMGNLSGGLSRRTGMSRKAALACSYAALVLFVTVSLVRVVPRAWKEGVEFGRLQIPAFRSQIANFLEEQLTDEGSRKKVSDLVGKVVDELSPAAVVSDAARIMQAVGRLLLFMFLSVILSLLVLWDPTFVRVGEEQVRASAIGWMYDEVAPTVQAFFVIVSKVFDAQIVIALVNTTLTLAGMIFLGIPGALFLSGVVFFCGLIPVFGAVISGAFILVAAIAHPPHSLWLVFEALLMVLLVHALEAYVLNPRIMGGHLHMHPFVVMLSLLVSEHFFGIWGVLLGVPAVTYAIQLLTGTAGVRPLSAPAVPLVPDHALPPPEA